MRLSKADKLSLFRLALGSSTTTADWRRFVPLSNRGLVEIDEEGRAWGRLFGVVTKSCSLTAAGRAALAEAMRDVSLWLETANEHARQEALKPKPRRCLCDRCTVAWMMRPIAA